MINFFAPLNCLKATSLLLSVNEPLRDARSHCRVTRKQTPQIFTHPYMDVMLLEPRLPQALLYSRLLEVADPGWVTGKHTPLSVQFLSFSCSFQRHCCQIKGWRTPPLWEILDLPLACITYPHQERPSWCSISSH